MSASYFDLLKYAATGIASPSMTYYDRMRASALMGGGSSTVTGEPPLIYEAKKAGYLSAWSISGNGVQASTPAPTNPVDFVGCGTKTANLWDKGVPIYAYATDYKKYNSANAIALKAGTYTISSDGTLPQIQAFHADLSPYTDIQDVIQKDASMYVGWDNRALLPAANTFRRTTIVITEDCIITMCCNVMYIGTYIMLNTGSSPLPYDPFGWKLTPTVTNGTDSTTTPIYLGTTQTVRRIRKLVLTGQETGWTCDKVGSLYRAILTLPALCEKGNAVACYSTHYVYGYGFVENTVYVGTTLQNKLYINDTAHAYYSDPNDALVNWLPYLAAQYDAGTPVTIWYVLTTPQIGITNEPLYRIEDYADTVSSTNTGAPQIPVMRGQNTLSFSETVQPSEVSVTGAIKPTT